MNELAAGVFTGAVGTTALNVVTYLDVGIRGRPPSELPSQAVEKLTEQAGVELADEGRDSEKASNRRSALGALMGYATGIGVGLAYGLVRRRIDRLPSALAAASLGVAAMVASDVPLTALGLTDPRKWGVSGWVADIAPHLAYGAATALAFERMNNTPAPRPTFRLPLGGQHSGARRRGVPPLVEPTPSPRVHSNSFAITARPLDIPAGRAESHSGPFLV